MKLIFIFLLLLTYLDAKVPMWISNPSLNGKYIGAVGCSKDLNNTSLQEKVAILRAKGLISQEIDIKINVKIKSVHTNEDDVFNEEFDIESEQKSNTFFEIKKMAQYIYKDGKLCVWLVKK